MSCRAGGMELKRSWLVRFGVKATVTDERWTWTVLGLPQETALKKRAEDDVSKQHNMRQLAPLKGSE